MIEKPQFLVDYENSQKINPATGKPYKTVQDFGIRPEDQADRFAGYEPTGFEVDAAGEPLATAKAAPAKETTSPAEQTKSGGLLFGGLANKLQQIKTGTKESFARGQEELKKGSDMLNEDPSKPYVPGKEEINTDILGPRSLEKLRADPEYADKFYETGANTLPEYEAYAAERTAPENLQSGVAKDQGATRRKIIGGATAALGAAETIFSPFIGLIGAAFKDTTGQIAKNAEAEQYQWYLKKGATPDEAAAAVDSDVKRAGDIVTKYAEPIKKFDAENPEVGKALEIGLWLLTGGEGKALKESTEQTILKGGESLSIAAKAGAEKTVAAAKAGAEQVIPAVKAGAEALGDFAVNAKEFVGGMKAASKETKIARITARIEELQANNQVQEAQAIFKAADEFGIKLPASATGSRLAQNIEGISSEGFFGGELKNRAQTAITKFDEIASGIEAKAKTSTEIGTNIEKSFQDATNAMRDAKNELYNNAESIIKENVKNKKTDFFTNAKGDSQVFGSIIPEQTIGSIDKALINLKKVTGIDVSGDISLLTKLKSGLNKLKKSPNGIENARATLKELSNKARFDKLPKDRTAEEKIFGNIWKNLSNDIDDSISLQIPEYKPAIEAANVKFKEIKNLEQMDFVRTIQTLSKKGQLDKISEKISNTNISKQEIQAIYETVGEATTKDIQDGIMRDIIQKARSSKEGFTAAGFEKQLKAIGEEKLSAVFTKEQLELLNKFNLLNKALASTQRVATGSQTGILQQISVGLKGALALGTMGKSLAVEFGVTKFLNSAKGQLWLRGLRQPAQKELEKLMGQLEKLTK